MYSVKLVEAQLSHGGTYYVVQSALTALFVISVVSFLFSLATIQTLCLIIQQNYYSFPPF